MTKILFASQDFPYALELLRDKLGEKFEIKVLDPKKNLTDQVEDVQVIIPAMTEVSGRVMDAAPELELIVQWGVGLEKVDLKSAEERGINVFNIPGKNAESVAECSLFLIFCLARKIEGLRKSFENGDIGCPVGSELRDKNLFIVGLGSSGRKLAKIAHGVGMNCRGIRKHPKKGAPDQVERLGGPEDLHKFLPWADYVSLHVPLEKTRNMISEKEFKKMKKSACIINVSRGPVISKEGLYRALIDEEIAGAGLDVFWTEPPNPEDKLYQLPNVVTTPHIGGVTKEAYQRIGDQLVKIIKKHLA